MSALIQRAARALIAAPIAYMGSQTLKSPAGAAAVAGPLLTRVREAAPSVPLPDDETIVRVNAGIQLVAGAMLAVGVAKRPAGLLLAGSLVPTTLAGHAFWAVEDPGASRLQRIQFLKNAVMVGAVLFAGFTSLRPCAGDDDD